MGPIMKSALVLLSFAFIIYIVEGEATGNKTFLLETKGDKKENGKYGQDYKGDEADYQYGDDEDLGLDDDITFDEAHEEAEEVEDEGSPTLLEAASSKKSKWPRPMGWGKWTTCKGRSSYYKHQYWRCSKPSGKGCYARDVHAAKMGHCLMKCVRQPYCIFWNYNWSRKKCTMIYKGNRIKRKPVKDKWYWNGRIERKC